MTITSSLDTDEAKRIIGSDLDPNYLKYSKLPSMQSVIRDGSSQPKVSTIVYIYRQDMSNIYKTLVIQEQQLGKMPVNLE